MQSQYKYNIIKYNIVSHYTYIQLIIYSNFYRYNVVLLETIIEVSIKLLSPLQYCRIIISILSPRKQNYRYYTLIILKDNIIEMF